MVPGRPRRVLLGAVAAEGTRYVGRAPLDPAAYAQRVAALRLPAGHDAAVMLAYPCNAAPCLPRFADLIGDFAFNCHKGGDRSESAPPGVGRRCHGF